MSAGGKCPNSLSFPVLGNRDDSSGAERAGKSGRPGPWFGLDRGWTISVAVLGEAWKGSIRRCSLSSGPLQVMQHCPGIVRHSWFPYGRTSLQRNRRRVRIPSESSVYIFTWSVVAGLSLVLLNQAVLNRTRNKSSKSNLGSNLDLIWAKMSGFA